MLSISAASFLFSFGFFTATQIALVDKGNKDQRNGQSDKRKDTVELA